ncbi:hypothetical protein [uncultured Aquimonas sp.]|jgi:hypothetical protein|uniref:hypothetical protein n=1 Tax=uncultured Aquimonas sp. TaxID=385483 RepID=UPI00086C5636|nr:hypothetical protein [uncultured Aquimonas sp.]ODU43681.1 MAG: hypothetical protein ABS96_22215 [Xanthomonadaceae bacterium SCN 69-123]
MRAVLLTLGLLLAIGGGVLVSGLIQLEGKNEVLRVGDKALEVGDGGIRVADRGEQGKTLGFVLLGVGVVLLVAGAMRKR